MKISAQQVLKTQVLIRELLLYSLRVKNGNVSGRITSETTSQVHHY